MGLRELRDVYVGQEIYIIGSGPTSNIFPMDYLSDKICMSLNSSYKIHKNITPIAFMHHINYSVEGKHKNNKFHPNFYGIKYPIAKGRGRDTSAPIDWDHEYFYFYDWNHEIERIYELTKNTDILYYTPEGCSLHAALQLCWIMGAKTIYTIGCDSMELGGKHYAEYDKNKFRDQEVLKEGQRNYDSYVQGTLIVQDFLRKKGINLFNLSSIIGYHMIEEQYDLLNNNADMDKIVSKLGKIKIPEKYKR